MIKNKIMKMTPLRAHEKSTQRAYTFLVSTAETQRSLQWDVLEIVCIATNNKRRALHDCIAGRVVVRKVSPGTGIRAPTNDI
jgi:hypothetical protein